MAFKPATKEQSKLRLALMGPSGSGKTYTSLEIAKHLGNKVAVIDSERGSASKYADLFAFDVCELPTHNPTEYIRNIKEAEAAGYDVIVIDSLSHAWMGKDGALELVDKAAKKSNSGNSFTAWRDITPLHNELVDAMLNAKCHIIATMRTKQEYVLEENEKGRKVPRKVGMAPIQRDGVEYEFDVTADLNIDHDLIVAKTRCHLVDGLVVRKPGKQFAETLKGWLESGVAASPKPQSSTKSTAGSAAPAAEQTVTTSIPADAAKQPEPSKVGATEMKQLLQVGEGNGWKRDQISAFMCSAFKLEPHKFAQTITWKQWETGVKILGRPENANGAVKVNSEGKPLSDEHQWPKTEQAA